MTAADRPSVTNNALAEAWAEGHRTGWEHCQDGNYGNDHWDDPTPNPYAAAGRAETTTEEWPRCKASRDGGCDRCHDEHGRHIHCRAETTTATTEDAAQVIERAAEVLVRDLTYSTGWDAEANDAIARTQAEALAESGLLATARTRPTRDELAKVICESRCSPQRKSWLETADAVLALLRGGAR